MKYIRLSFVFLLFQVNLLAQNIPDPDTLNQFDPQGRKDGYWIVRNEEGVKVYEGQFEHGNPVGRFVRYFDNGNKKAQMEYLPDGQRVLVTFFYPNGKLAAKGHYKDQQKDGTWLYYSYYHGHLSLEEHYDAGVKQGKSTKYYPDGSISELTFWKDGKRHGAWKQYYENGRLKLMGRFEHGKLEGPFEVYNHDGETSVSGNYLNNTMHGTWKYFDPDGKEDFQVIYNNGKPANPDILEKRAEEFFQMMDENLGKIPEPDESLFEPQR